MYISKACPICFRFEMQLTCWAFSLALASAGNNMAAKMAIMATTRSNSTKVKPIFLGKSSDRSFLFNVIISKTPAYSNDDSSAKRSSSLKYPKLAHNHQFACKKQAENERLSF